MLNAAYLDVEQKLLAAPERAASHAHAGREASSCLGKREETAGAAAKKNSSPRDGKPSVSQLSDTETGGLAPREGACVFWQRGLVGASSAPVQSKHFAAKDPIKISLRR